MIFDKNGMNVGSFSENKMKIANATDWSEEIKVVSLNIFENSDGTAEIYSQFYHLNNYGYKIFEFNSNLNLW